MKRKGGMRMVLGIITAVAYVLAKATASFKRLARLHAPLGYLLFALSAVHLALAARLVPQRPVAVTVLGSLMFFLIAAAIATAWLRKYRLHRILALLVIPLLIAHVAACVAGFTAYRQAVAELAVSDVDATTVADGRHLGACDVGYIYAEVEVTVADGKIAGIELLEHRNERGARGEGVIPEILAAQRVGVDAVTGATNSSEVIKKAVESALEQGARK